MMILQRPDSRQRWIAGWGAFQQLGEPARRAMAGGKTAGAIRNRQRRPGGRCEG
jgi:hypothetical protein